MDMDAALQQVALMLADLTDDGVWDLCMALASGRDAKRTTPDLAHAFAVLHAAADVEWSRRAAAELDNPQT